MNKKNSLTKFTSIAAAFSFCCSVNAQTFSYTLGQTSSTYQQLSGATTVANSPAWSSSGYKIPIGFSYGFSGKSFDSLTIASNGLLLFGDDNNRAIATFKGITPVSEGGGTSSI